MRFHSLKLSLGGLLGALCASAGAQGFSPEAASRRMTLPDDLAVQLVAGEPLIVQPVCIEFDDRGRLWVVQYVQYPNPAGLQRTRVDRWSRTVYDRVPQPPPLGPKGADRITILEDKNSDGRADATHDFLTGLNLATGIAFGHGGVFVLNVPYLLFYPDRNRDDLPDGDPEVCIEGFGMEDAHSVANSLTWGPDGWLYGCQGSTVTARIRGIEFQQGIWRYHPLTREFELFCEGGGNSWGLDFDEDGELIYSTNVGPYRHLHGMQGAYYWKSFGKHGALHNPYAFGYFDHIRHTNFTGGHVTDGGIIYRGTNLPPRFRNRYVCGDLLGHGVQWHEMFRCGSTFTSAHGGYLLAANDTWFAPTDVTVSPDGAVYVADWCDPRTAHPDPDAHWDRSNGRVYRIAARNTGPMTLPAFAGLKSTELVRLLGSDNPWIVRHARRALADRRDPEVILPLRTAILETQKDPLALEFLWALHVSGGFNEAFAEKTLRHRNPAVRKWTVRLLGDTQKVSPALAANMEDLARSEPDVRVRAQLAASARRLPPNEALPIVESLLVRDADGADPCVPLLLWWAVEQHAINALPAIEKFFVSPAAWKSELARDVVLGRLLRRWTAEGTPATYNACARLLAAAPGETESLRLFAALAQGFHDRPAENIGFGSGGLFASVSAPELNPRGTPKTPVREQITPSLALQIARRWRDDTTNTALIGVAARIGQAAARQRARELAADASAARRIDMIRLLGELAADSDAPLLLKLIGSEDEIIQLAAVDALSSFVATNVPGQLLACYPSLRPRVRSRVRDLLLSRKSWAGALLREVDGGRIAPGEIAIEQLRVIALHEDKALGALVKKHWGNVSRGTAEEQLAEMRRLNNDLNAGRGDALRGQELFRMTCAACHQLFGEGGTAGPDLTHANRADREFLLASIVDPSAVIRKENLAYEAETNDGRVLTGVIVGQSASDLTLGIANGERVSVARSGITSLRESALSLMPENLLKALKPQEVRDLFAYLQSTDAKPAKRL